MDDARKKMIRRENVFLATLWAGILLMFGSAALIDPRLGWHGVWPWLELVGLALIIGAELNSPHPDRSANRH